MDSQSGSVPGWYLFEACVILDDWFARQMHQFTILRSIFLKGFDLLEQNKGCWLGDLFGKIYLFNPIIKRADFAYYLYFIPIF